MPNKIYSLPETAILFTSSGGDVVLTMTSVTSGAGRLSARWDRGSGAKPMTYRLDGTTFKTSAAPTIGRTVRLYLVAATAATGAAETDGQWDHTDQAISSEDRVRNLTPIGQVQADINSNPSTLSASGEFEIRSRYVQLAAWNDLGATLSATGTDCFIKLTPVSFEIQ